MKDTFKEIIKDYILNNEDKNFSEIATLIVESGEINRSHRTIRLYVAEVSEMLNKEEFTKLVNHNVKECEDEPPVFSEGLLTIKKGEEIPIPYEEIPTVEVNENSISEEDGGMSTHYVSEYDEYSIQFINDIPSTYILKYCSEFITIPIETVDKVFLAHSKNGLGLTEHQTIKLLAISDSEFKAIKARLSLCKDAEPLGPYSEETVDNEKSFEMIAKYSAELLRELGDVDDPIRASLIRETKKQLVLMTNKNKLFKSFVDDLKNHIKTLNIRELDRDKKPISLSKEISVVISDLHLGVKTDVFNLKVAEQKLEEVQTHLNGFTSLDDTMGVNIILPGDIMHNISGYMHADSMKHTEEGIWGADSIIKPFELLLSFFLGIKNLKAIYIVGGNHDRINANWKEENSAEGAKLLSYMLKSTLPNSIPVEFNSRLIKFVSGNLKYIIQHGDLKADKKSKVEEVVWEHGNKDKFNIVLTGHHHTRIIQRNDDTYHAMRMSVPAFSPSDDYAKDCGYNNNPGFLLIQEKQGRPLIIDIPLIY